MQFEFKTPKDETLKTMSDVASGKLNNTDFEKECENKVCELTNSEHAKITSSGNNSIFVALSSIKGDVIIPDQGGWHGFKQIAKFLNKNIITLKTDLGLINPYELDIVLPELHLAIEFNGNHWHEEGIAKPIGYHEMKLKMCNDVRL